MNDLNGNLYEKYKSFASSPLLLTIMLITYESTYTLPDKLNGFYEKTFEALFYSHDLSKNRYKRKLKTKLGYDDFKRIFSRVCFKSYIKNEFEFTFDSLCSYIDEVKRSEAKYNFKSEDFIEDLEMCLCMIIKEGFEYRFVHRSFQEYFAAKFIEERNDDEQVKIFQIICKNCYPFIYEIQNFWYIVFDIQQDRLIKNFIVYNLRVIETAEDALKAYIENSFFEVGVDDATNGLVFGIQTPSFVFFAMQIFSRFKISQKSQFKNTAKQNNQNNKLEISLEKEWLEHFGKRSISVKEFVEDKIFYEFCLDNNKLYSRELLVNSYLIWVREYREREKKQADTSDETFIDSL